MMSSANSSNAASSVSPTIATRRRSERFPTNEDISVQIYGNPSRILGKMKNISQTGARLDVVFGHTTPKPGDLLNLTIHLSSIDKVKKIDAEVIWTQGNAVGVNFLPTVTLVEKLIAGVAHRK